MKYAVFILCLPLLACSTAQVKKAGQAVSTTSLTAGLSLINPPLGVTVGLLNFLGWELALSEDKNEELQRQLDDPTRAFVEAKKEEGLAAAKTLFEALLWAIARWTLGIVAFLALVRFVLKKYVLSKKEAKRLDDFIERVADKAVKRVKDTVD